MTVDDLIYGLSRLPRISPLPCCVGKFVPEGVDGPQFIQTSILESLAETDTNVILYAAKEEINNETISKSLTVERVIKLLKKCDKTKSVKLRYGSLRDIECIGDTFTPGQYHFEFGVYPYITPHYIILFDRNIDRNFIHLANKSY